MKKLLLPLVLLSAFCLAWSFFPGTASASEPLPYCAMNGDLDGDGVPDDIDSDETDSCLASSTGYENCSTGAGDGMPDCQPWPNP